MRSLIITHEIGHWFRFSLSGRVVIADSRYPWATKLFSALVKQSRIDMEYPIYAMTTRQASLEILINSSNRVVSCRIIEQGVT